MEWKHVSERFEQIWKFPHCMGAIDGKLTHTHPAHSGSTFFNDNGTHSVLLLAVCDAHYCSTIVDIGDVGRHCDGVFSVI